MTLVRKVFDPGFTIGELAIDGQPFCFICEDTVRQGKKVHGQTAIPAGTYNVVVTYSPRFKKQMPLLENVPGFSGIRIHAGNTAKDTEGCLLPGFQKTANGVGQSRAACKDLYARIDSAIAGGQRVSITIS